MVVPLFGANNVTENAGDNIVGVLQLINKCDQHISSFDVQQAEYISDLLGRCVENTGEHHAVINMKVGVQKSLLTV